MGYFREESDAVVCIIQFATIMRQTIADDEVVSSQFAVVSGNLLKYLFSNWYARGLVFHNHTWTRAIAIKKNRIATT